MNTITEDDALNRAAAYCSAAEHCRSEVNDKLQKWGLSYEVIQRILDRLEKEKFIDTDRYCRAFVDDKYRFAKWGKLKISQSLYLKKIAPEISRRYLEKIDEEEYLGILRNLLSVKRKSIRAKDEFELNGKLIRFAMSRGFEMNDIRRCVRLSDEDEYIY